MQMQSVFNDLLPVVEGMLGGPTHDVVPQASSLCDLDIEACVCRLLPAVDGVRVKCDDGWVTIERGIAPWIEVEVAALSIPGVKGLSHHT